MLLTVLLLDCSTKRLAVEALSPPDVPHDVVGDVFRLTLAYNRGMATGIPVGSRWLLTGAAVVVIGILWRAYLRTAPGETVRLIALALLTGGAIGNVIDRVRWARGVVDFVDLGVGGVRFWTFNVADVAVTAGALLLAWVLQNRPEAPIEVEAKGPDTAA
ncbi:MAG TPA: signal peptidase II [Gemmatimonadaceae bacterium]|nr:signal peptidase II [Gemmatimonadaceae bacterium]